PERPLEPGSLRLELAKTLAAEHLFEPLISQLRVCDRDSPLERSKVLLLLFVAGLCDQTVESLVDRSVDSAHEEACDRGNLVDRFAFGDAALEPAQVRFHRSLISLEREQQSDVDIDAFVDALLDGRNALGCARNLDHQ